MRLFHETQSQRIGQPDLTQMRLRQHLVDTLDELLLLRDDLAIVRKAIGLRDNGGEGDLVINMMHRARIPGGGSDLGINTMHRSTIGRVKELLVEAGFDRKNIHISSRAV